MSADEHVEIGVARKTYSTTTSLGENVLKVNGAVEAERAIGQDVNPVTLVVARGVEDGDLAMLACTQLPSSIATALTSPAWTKYPVTSRFFLSGEILT